MYYCVACGHQLIENAQFCMNCGHQVGIPAPTTEARTERNIIYDGNIYKCPNCGEILNAFEMKCHLCGYELRDNRVSSSIKQFYEKYKLTQSNREKINLVNSLTIPNNREDIYEFAILASSSVDLSYYRQNRGLGLFDAKPNEVINAWMAKFEQAYQKACLVLQGDPYLSQINALYSDKKKCFNKAQKRMSPIPAGICITLSIVIMLFTAILLVVLTSAKDEKENEKIKELESLVEEIEELIDAKKYELALIKAEKIRLTGSGYYSKEKEEWDDIRESLIRRIEKLQAESEGKTENFGYRQEKN